MWENRLAGMGICWMAVRGWWVTLVRWQNWQSLHQLVMSVDMPVNTRLAVMRRLVALIPGRTSVWTVAKAAYRNGSSNSGPGAPVEKSQMS